MKMNKLILLSALPLALIACKEAEAPKTTSGNPVIEGLYADPTIRDFGGTYWLYTSTDVPGQTTWEKMKEWHAFSSTDLVNWKDHGVIFDLDDVSWADKKAFAPDCVYRNGKYYFYFPADGQIGVAVSDNPAGPFEDALGRPLITREMAPPLCIDPCVLIDDDGQAYIYFGGRNKLRMAKLNPDMVSIDGEPIDVDMEEYHEGIWVHKYNGKYYFSYPTFADQRANKMGYSVADSPYGPYEYKGIILDNDSRNIHGSIARLGDNWYVFYHRQVAGPGEREVCAEFLEYNPDGTIKPMGISEEGISLSKPDKK